MKATRDPNHEKNLKPLYLHWNEEIEDHVTTTELNMEGYTRLRQVGSVLKGAFGLGDGVVLPNNTSVCEKQKILAEDVVFPRDWELAFELTAVATTVEESEFLRFEDTDGKLVLSCGFKKQSQQIVVRTADVEVKSTMVIPIDKPVNINLRHTVDSVKQLALLVDGAEDSFKPEPADFSLSRCRMLHCGNENRVALVRLSDITLCAAQNFSVWEQQIELTYNDSEIVNYPTGSIEHLVSARYGTGNTWRNVTKEISKVLKRGGLELKVRSGFFAVPPAKVSRQLVVRVIPRKRMHPTSGVVAGNKLFPLCQMYNHATKKHVLTSAPEKLESQGFRTLRFEGFAYSTMTPELMLASIDTYISKQSGDIVAVIDLKTLERIRSMSQYTLIQNEGCIFPVCNNPVT